MEAERQVYKNPEWSERKRELKAIRGQRTTKSIKNIRAIDSPCDPDFNCTFPPTQTLQSRLLPPLRRPQSTATSLATRYFCV